MADSTAPVSGPRIHAVDYLRGFFALSIMVYHYSTWSGVSGNTLSKFGIYGVSAFYVISGISFGYVYRRFELTTHDVLSFGIKRFFRLAPLFWIATLGAFLFRGGTWKVILLNLTLTFGVIAPAAYLPTGGWSIGNEVAFYCILPFAIVALRKRPWIFATLVAMSIGVAAWYAFVRLNPSATLASQWRSYIMPTNQVFLFLVGVSVSALIGKEKLSARVSYTALAVIAIVFALLPVGADEVSLVTGWSRFAYSAVCVAVCAIGALGTFPVPRVIDRVLAWGGEKSYAIYLLHPLAYLPLQKMGLSVSTILLVCVPLTFVAAHLVYRYIEAPMIRKGKILADSLLVSASPRGMTSVAT